jgi:hypothetical protein
MVTTRLALLLNLKPGFEPCNACMSIARLHMHVGHVGMSGNLRLVTLRLVTGDRSQLSRTKSQCKGTGEVTLIINPLGELCHIQTQSPKYNTYGTKRLFTKSGCLTSSTPPDTAKQLRLFIACIRRS